jgi:anti-sigma factor RsiW
MNCQEIKALKHAYADRELDLVRTTEIERHLSDCRACSQAYENIRVLSSALKSSDLYFKAPAHLRRRIRASLPNEARSSSSQPFDWRQWLKWGIPIAGTTMIAFLLATSFNRASTDERLAQEVTANHVRSLMATHLTDVTSSDQHTVKPWFDGKLDFAPPVKDLAAQGFPLVGGRLDYLQNRSVAALVYERHKHLINLFIWPASRSSNTPEKPAMRQGYNLIHWNQSGMTFWAVSDLNAVELREFVELTK